MEIDRVEAVLAIFEDCREQYWEDEHAAYLAEEVPSKRNSPVSGLMIALYRHSSNKLSRSGSLTSRLDCMRLW